MRIPGPLLAATIVLFGGCSDPASPPSPEPTPEELPPVPPRIVVVNGLSHTLSTLDPDTRELAVQAVVTGTVPNRVARMEAHLLVVVSGANRIEMLRPWDLSPAGGIDLGPGANPWTAVPLGDGRALVTSWQAGDVRLVDPEAGTAGPPLSTTRGPEGAAVLDGLAWIACTNYAGGENSYDEGRVDVVDLDAWEVIDSVPVGKNPQDVLVGSDGRLHVLCTGVYDGAGAGTGSVHVIDPAARAVADTLQLGGSPGAFAQAPDGTVWVAGFAGGVRRYRAEPLALLPDPSDPALAWVGFSSVDVDSTTGTVWVTNFDQDLLLAVDPGKGRTIDAWTVGDGPVDVRVVR
jgi:DNA-binding beta-propeller fold protein YncE